jgi:hypothetical protein
MAWFSDSWVHRNIRAQCGQPPANAAPPCERWHGARLTGPLSQPLDTVTMDSQDVVNQLLAAALHADAAVEQIIHAVTVAPAHQARAVADLVTAAAALSRIRDRMLQAADELGDDPGR